MVTGSGGDDAVGYGYGSPYGYPYGGSEKADRARAVKEGSLAAEQPLPAVPVEESDLA